MSGTYKDTGRPGVKKTRTALGVQEATTRLFTSTKGLIQSLTAWAGGAAGVDQVSASYVKLGDDFNACRKGFSAAGVDVSDIEDVPALLRQVLETSLALEPSQATLDSFLPRIGDIVNEMIKTLKVKQAAYQAILDSAKEQRKLSDRSVSGPPTVSSYSNGIASSTSSSNATTPSSSLPASDTRHHVADSKDPLSRLQQNSTLKRKGSKRFSVYQSLKTQHVPSFSEPIEESSDSATPSVTASSTATTTVDTMPNTPRSPLQQEVSRNIRESQSQIKMINGDYRRSMEKSVNGSAISNSNGNYIYLKHGNKVKKISLSLPTSFAQLRISFTQKFGYSGEEGEEHPPFYIADDKDSISYELEDVNDITAGSIISIYEPDVTSIIVKHMEKQMGSMKEELSLTQTKLLEKMEEISNHNSTPSSNVDSKDIKATSTHTNTPAPTVKTGIQEKELRALRLELSKVRQASADSKKKLTATVTEALTLVSQFQKLSTSSQGILSDPYMEHCKNKVSADCEDLVNRIDALQDVIETLRGDISRRGSRPTKQHLTEVFKEMEAAKTSLNSVDNYMTVERESWNQRWQKGLTTILEEQEFFKEQGTIIKLLSDDMINVDETYALILKCCDELDKNPRGFNSGLNLPLPDPNVSASQLKDALMLQVQALNPDHESRLEAIEKAERIREKEKMLADNDEFKVELSDFVEGEKLKKSGGIEEVERMRKLKDEENLKGQFGFI